MTMDEATTTSNMRVCSLLVCYFNGVNIFTKRLDSFNAPFVNSATLYHEVMDIFQKREILLKNLLAVMMDSCAVMRGHKTGLEKRLRNGPVPHLLEIDRDLFHHIHNVVKDFLNNFENYLQKLLPDLYRDFDVSADLLQRLELLCYHIGVTFCKPPNYVAFCWLSVLQVCIDFLYMRDVRVIFYSAFVNKRQSQIKKNLESIFERYNVPKGSQESIEEMVKALSKKKFNSDDKAGKISIVNVVLLNESKVTLVTSIYQPVLPIFKKYVMLFQKKNKPMIHKLYYDQIDLFNQFWS